MNAPTSVITPEIRKMIEDQLPGQVGTILKDRLALLDKLEPLAKSLQQDNTDLRTEVTGLKASLQDQAALAKTLEELKTRQEDVARREREMKVTILELRVLEAERRADNAYELVRTLVKTPDRIKSITESASTPVGVNGGPNSCGFVQQGTETRTVTESQHLG
jgi:chromosome segregation ATPase